MLEHHKKSIENLIEYFKNDADIISIVLGGSVAKGLERADSDIDVIIIVIDTKYAALEKENRTAECIYGHCTYEHGYFDIKYITMKKLETLAQKGSEPSRNTFQSSKFI
jgi:predicted nucleotidyltransferase